MSCYLESAAWEQRENAKLEKTGNDLNKMRDKTVSGQKEAGGEGGKKLLM